jgi:hypothetical protein
MMHHQAEAHADVAEPRFVAELEAQGFFIRLQ